MWPSTGQVTQGRCLPVLVWSRAGICDSTGRRHALALPTEAHFVCQKPVGHQFGPGSLCPVPLPVTRFWAGRSQRCTRQHQEASREHVLVSGGFFSTCVCVCLCVASWVPATVCSPGRGAERTQTPAAAADAGSLMGRRGVSGGPGRPWGIPAQTQCCAASEEGSGPGAGPAVPVRPSESNLRAGPAAGGLAPSTRFRVAAPLS